MILEFRLIGSPAYSHPFPQCRERFLVEEKILQSGKWTFGIDGAAFQKNIAVALQPKKQIIRISYREYHHELYHPRSMPEENQSKEAFPRRYFNRVVKNLQYRRESER